MKPTTIKGEIVKEYLSRFPKAAHLTLAKKIQSETGILFDSVDQCRSLIRNYTGSMGEKGRKQLTDRRFMRTETIDSGENPYELPDSDALDYPIFKIPRAQNKILVVSDAHIPYHDNAAMTATIEWGVEHKVNTILLNGDWIDLYQLSSFVRDPRKRRFNEEREIFWQVLDVWQNAFPNAVFYYKFANHEARYEKYLMVKAPDIFDTEEYRLDVLLRLGERSIIPICDKIRIKAGKLTILHGDEHKGGNANLVNPARWLALKTKGNAMCSHFHKTSSHMTNNINGEMMGCWSIGTMCALSPEYMPLNDWNAGFARVIVNDDETFKVTNLIIYDGKIQ